MGVPPPGVYVLHRISDIVWSNLFSDNFKVIGLMLQTNHTKDILRTKTKDFPSPFISKLADETLF